MKKACTKKTELSRSSGDEAGTLKSFLTLDALVTADPNTLPAQDTDAYTEEDNEEDDEEELELDDDGH